MEPPVNANAVQPNPIFLRNSRRDSVAVPMTFLLNWRMKLNNWLFLNCIKSTDLFQEIINAARERINFGTRLQPAGPVTRRSRGKTIGFFAFPYSFRMHHKAHSPHCPAASPDRRGQKQQRAFCSSISHRWPGGLGRTGSRLFQQHHLSGFYKHPALTDHRERIQIDAAGLALPVPVHPVLPGGLIP